MFPQTLYFSLRYLIHNYCLAFFKIIFQNVHIIFCTISPILFAIYVTNDNKIFAKKNGSLSFLAEFQI